MYNSCMYNSKMKIYSDVGKVEFPSWHIKAKTLIFLSPQDSWLEIKIGEAAIFV